MNYLKNGLFLLLAFTVLGLSSCSKDDEDCVAPDLAENIIGTWDLELSMGEVEFQADGTLIDPDDTLFGVEINGVVYSEKTYVVDGTTLSVTAAAPNGGGSSSADFEVTSNECDEIVLDIGFGFSDTMNRK